MRKPDVRVVYYVPNKAATASNAAFQSAIDLHLPVNVIVEFLPSGIFDH